MSEPVASSEIPKSTSGEISSPEHPAPVQQNKQEEEEKVAGGGNQQHPRQIQPVVVLPSPSNAGKSVNSSSRNNGAVKSNGITRVVVGSRNGGGSQFLPSLHNATLPSKIAIIVGLCQVGIEANSAI
jgi:hypothetical protein